MPNSLYYLLPSWAKSIAASVHGFRLSGFRYGSETDGLVEEALERDYWDSSKWTAWQQMQVRTSLRSAGTLAPHYQLYWNERGIPPSDDLKDWPVLEKDVLRSDPKRFLIRDLAMSRFRVEHTSGTTGKPLTLWVSKFTSRRWYALFEARVRRWNGISRHDAWGIIGGQLVAAAKQTEPPFWVWNRPMRQLYMSAYHLSPQLIPSYLKAISQYRLQYLLGYPSALYALACAILDGAKPVPALRVVITNAEPLYEHQRTAIESAFGCPVRETYAMSEMAGAASECEHGSLHIWNDAGVMELTGEDRDGCGDLILTGLVNRDMPLIRYHVGDRACMAPASERCTCGRTLPMIRRIEGRFDDVLYTRDGRAIGRLDPIFKSDLQIREAQIIQESLSLIRVVYVPPFNGDAEHIERILSRELKKRLGEIDIRFEDVSVIPRSANGKFRAVICKLPAHQRGKSRAATL